MSLIDTIKADQLTARKNREAIRASLLTTLLGEANMVAKNANREKPTDDEVTAVIRKFLKGNAEVLAHADDADSLVASKEKEVLESYLPKQMTEDELWVAVKKAIAEGATNVGAVMGYLKTNHAGLYDGKMASTLIKAELG